MMNSVESVIKEKYTKSIICPDILSTSYLMSQTRIKIKVENMDRFIDNLTEHIEDFLSEWMFHLDDETLVEKYRESWMKI